MSVAASRLSAEAAREAAALPPLLAQAERLAASVWGVHGRRAAGAGETFWQYRQAQPGDAADQIDWRRSGRADELYVRETEWETAQTVWVWPDDAASMRFSSAPKLPEKGERAALLALALTMLLERGGERFAILGRGDRRVRRGRAGVNRAALNLTKDRPTPGDYGAPPPADFSRGARAAFLSDFFGDLDALGEALRRAAARQVRGVLMHVLDPVEEAFPYRGRVLFESLAGHLRYDADRAEALQDAYRAKLADRRAWLRDAARRAGWRVLTHRTDAPAAPALLALHGALQHARIVR